MQGIDFRIYPSFIPDFRSTELRHMQRLALLVALTCGDWQQRPSDCWPSFLSRPAHLRRKATWIKTAEGAARWDWRTCVRCADVWNNGGFWASGWKQFLQIYHARRKYSNLKDKFGCSASICSGVAVWTRLIIIPRCAEYDLVLF